MKLNMCLWSVSANAAMNILHAGMDFNLEGSMFVRSSRLCSREDGRNALLVSLSFCSRDKTPLENRQSANPLSTSRHWISLEIFSWMDSSTTMINIRNSEKCSRDINYIIIMNIACTYVAAYGIHIRHNPGYSPVTVLSTRYIRTCESYSLLPQHSLEWITNHWTLNEYVHTYALTVSLFL